MRIKLPAGENQLLEAGGETGRRIGQDLLVRAAGGQQYHGGGDGGAGQRGGIACVRYDGDERRRRDGG
ncbi:MAG TPA: hypothetical protein VFD73_21050 [Gemmatimonadales bacterium]|nr:hypothetical protein [Gemmatimonadales bacterium]